MSSQLIPEAQQVPIWSATDRISGSCDRRWGNPRKLEAVHHYNKRPETKTEVKSFLGLISYYRKFVPQYATISTPLSDLLKVHCTPECERAFQTLKKKLGESPVLIILDFSRPFAVQTDASNVGIGAVLNQKELMTKSTQWHL